MAGHQVLDRCSGHIRQAPEPKRYFDVAFLRKLRIEVDGDQDNVLQIGRRLGVIEDFVVERVQESDAEMRLQSRIGSADAIEPGQLGDDVAGRVPVPGADLVFFRVQIFFASGQGLGLAQFERSEERRVGKECRL